MVIVVYLDSEKTSTHMISIEIVIFVCMKQVNVMSGHQFLHPILPCEFLDSPEFESSRATIDEKFKVCLYRHFPVILGIF